MAHTRTKEDLLKAIEKVEHGSLDPSYISFRFSYASDAIILPYLEGLKVLAAFENAEVYFEGYSSQPAKVKPLDRDSLKYETITSREVKLMKMSQLLDIPLCQLNETFKQAEIEPPF